MRANTEETDGQTDEWARRVMWPTGRIITDSTRAVRLYVSRVPLTMCYCEVEIL